MSMPGDHETRISALETRVDEIDVTMSNGFADLTVKVDANRTAINALGVQTAERFDRLEQRFNRLEYRFDGFQVEVRTSLAAISHKFGEVDRRFSDIDRRFEQVDQRFAQVDQRFDQLTLEMRAKFDQTAAGQAHIAAMLSTLIERESGE